MPVTHGTFRLFPESASTVSDRVDALTGFLLLASGLVTLIVLVLIVAFAIRFRRRAEDEVPPATRSHVWLEIGWSVIPLLIFVAMFYWGAALYADMKRPAGAGALEIHVLGKQWMWKLQHPGGQREIDELHVPLGRPVKLIMTSQDVIHDFSIPAFRIKQDVLPGSYVTQWFTATKAGEYHLFCAEYCGTMHSGMVGRVVVMQPGDYEAWLAGVTPDEPPAASGARLFVSLGCAQCHGQNAPTLAGLYGRAVTLADGSTVTADEEYLRESIENPPARIVAGFEPRMPSFRGQLTAEQLGQLVAYIKSLAPTSPAERLPNQPPAKGSTDYGRNIGDYHQP
jgi:cytochrome c oxidase subunit 2